MIKLLFKLIFTLIILVVLAVCGIYYHAGEIIKTAVEKFAPQVTQTDVKLNNVDISLFNGRIALNGLSVANPAGYGAEKAFGVGNVVVTFDPKSFLTDKIVINQVLIEGTQVSAEATYKDGTISSNITDIQNSVEKFLGSSEKSANQEPKQEEKPAQAQSAASKQVVIRDLQINNSEITVGIMKKTLTLPLPNIHQTNIGEKGKEMSWKDSLAYVFNLISTEAVKETATAVNTAVKEAAAQALESVGAIADNAKEAAGAAADTAKEAAGSVLDSAGKLGDSVKGLFGK